jgi:ferritin-like metal-binding protein YciE
MATMKTLEDAFVHELKDIYSAEKQIATALGKIIKKVENRELRQALEGHREQTQEQVRRVEQAFKAIGKTARAEKCKGIEGILAENADTFDKIGDDDLMDAMLLAGAQKVEHYEIATYGTLCTWGEMLGFDEAVELLKENLGEEKEADEKLTEIATSMVNERAMSGAEGAEEEEEEDEGERSRGRRRQPVGSRR